MVVGTLSLMQKGQTSGFSRCNHTADTVHSGRSGCSMQWMQSEVDAVDIVFDANMSNQWIQWMQSHSVHSTQWTQWTQYAVDAICSGGSRIVVYGGGDIVFDTKGQNGHSGCST